MEWILIAFTAFTASVLTFFSGFGLGTILMPVVAIFLPVPVAVAITALVHWLNKIFKVMVMWKHIDRAILVAFGLPAMIAAIPGALLLTALSRQPAIASYALAGHDHPIYPVKLAAGLLLLFFATAEWVPFLQTALFLRMGLPVGGALSGFFGGLTGHQGAFRSAFLVNRSLSESAFVATNAAIAALVDSARLLIYGMTFGSALVSGQFALVAVAVLASFLGVTLGARLLKKVTIGFMQKLVAVMMYLLGGLLCAGLI